MVIQPVGPLPPKVYWARRAALLAVAVVVLVVAVWLVTGRGGDDSPANTAATGSGSTSTSGSGSTSVSSSPLLTGDLFPELATSTPSTEDPKAEETSAAAASEAAAAESAAAEAAAAQAAATAEAAAAESAAAESAAAESAAAQAAADAAAAAQAQADAAAAAQAAADAAAAQAAAEAAAAALQYDAQGRLICPDSSIGLTATVGAPTYTVGQQPILGVTVQNTGDTACVRDVSGSLQEYLIYDAAGNRLWSTADCVPGTGTEVRFLEPGQTLQYNIKWSGTTSTPGCATDRVTVPAGEYKAEARLGAVVSSQAVLTFQ